MSTKEKKDYSWMQGLDRGDKGILGTAKNVIAAINTAPELRGCVMLDTFADRMVVTRDLPWRKLGKEPEWLDTDEVNLLVWLQSADMKVSSVNVMHDAAKTVAKHNPFHPVRDYLGGLKWDGRQRIDGWLTKFLGVEQSDYSAMVGRKFLISAVARILRPGCKVDTMLIFEGSQGVKKSMAITVLAGEWVCESMPDIKTKDAMLQLQGSWIVEVAELAAMRKGEVEHIKQFISSQQDRFRPPYGRNVVTRDRQCVFIGTTNESHYLIDGTGNRRFWPIQCSDIDIKGLRVVRDQLWAEAVIVFQSGENWWMEEDAEIATAEAEQEERMAADPWIEIIERFAEGRTYQVSILEVSEQLCLPTEKLNPMISRRISGILKQLGWEKGKRIRVSGAEGDRRSTVFYPPESHLTVVK